MQLTVHRYSDQNDSTLGLLFVDGWFECYTIEDRFREKKVWGKTRIPEGKYEIELKKQSRFDKKYEKRIRNYKGMLHILNVPNYKGVLIHIGNTAEDTAGCLLVGNRVNNNNCEKGMIYDSTSAFKTLYRKVVDELEYGGEVTIEFVDSDKGIINKNKEEEINDDFYNFIKGLGRN